MQIRALSLSRGVWERSFAAFCPAAGRPRRRRSNDAYTGNQKSWLSFGGLRAVDEFNLTVEQGQLYGLIGPNGAGKTTVFNLLTGVYRPTTGGFFLDGETLAGKTPLEINRRGIARTFQNIRLFKQMSVIDNVKVGLHNAADYSILSALAMLPRYFREEKALETRARELLDVFGLDGEREYLASNLPYGKQRKLEIAVPWLPHPNCCSWTSRPPV